MTMFNPGHQVYYISEVWDAWRYSRCDKGVNEYIKCQCMERGNTKETFNIKYQTLNDISKWIWSHKL